MHLRIGNFLIKGDTICYTLYELKVVREKEEGDKGKAPKPENIGKEREHALGYYGTFKQALRGMSEKMIGSSDASKVEELVGLLDGIEEAIINIPDELGETVHSFVTYRDSWRSIVEHVLRSLSEDNKEEAMAKLHRLKEGLGRIPEVWEEEMKEEADDGGGDA